jgi:ribonucleoside-diphosphate reductase alpha chain
VDLQQTSQDVWAQKYQLKDWSGGEVDQDVDDTYRRVAQALAEVETTRQNYWADQFFEAMKNGAIPAGRILSNAGAKSHKPATSLINCTVSEIVEDSMKGILTANLNAGITLAAGCGIGYEFSTLRPRGAYVNGAGATTSGSVSFMDIFDAMCFTVSSAGGRRGAQMATMAVWHPDVESFITAKREDGRLRQFNLSVLIDDEFMFAVKHDLNHNFVFPVKQSELDKGVVDKSELVLKPLFWDKDYCLSQDYVVEDDQIFCKVYKTVKAKDLFDQVMKLTYDYAEPGFILIDEVNRMNNLWWCENIRATNP